MRKFLNSIRKLQRNNMIYVILGLQVISIVAYIFASKGLEKPAGIREAMKFLLFNPDKYLISILLGLVSWSLFIICIISLIVEIPIIRDALDDNYNWYFENVPTWKIILNTVLVIILLILNILFLKYLAVLILIIILLIGIILLYSMNN